MRTAVHRMALAALLGLGGTDTACAQGEAKPDLVVRFPREGETHQGTAGIVATITGYPENKPLIVRVTVYGVTHHLQPTLRREYRAGRMVQTMEVNDGLFPMSAGEHTMKVLLFVGSAGEPAVRREVKFKLVPQDAADTQSTLAAVQDKLRLGTDVDLLARDYEAAEHMAARNAGVRAQLPALADGLYLARLRELTDRVAAYCELRPAYLSRFDRERALGCLVVAEQIWTADAAQLRHPLKGVVGTKAATDLIDSPRHLSALAYHYLMFGQGEESIRYFGQQAAFYQEQIDRGHLRSDQRRLAFYNVSNRYGEIAMVHLRLRYDLTAHKQWTDRAAQVRAQGDALKAP